MISSSALFKTHLMRSRQLVTRPTSSTVSSFSDTEYFAILSIIPLVVAQMMVVVVMIWHLVFHALGDVICLCLR